ncbi:alanine racemase [Sinorhizobium sp. BG8]|uniref:alanine racemase n=1 Tax=Sinorhizobium sp. BG8 TaxID=2613773 RepID=UPI00193E0112|nr:alanine racemase [Sinorhizobium sp. BG8]QRM54861.1 alanine racemase [Sinorhizobium sp. BG8]
MNKNHLDRRHALPIAGEDHARLTIDLGALASNWRSMSRRSGAARTAAVLKANAYGIGLESAARTLFAAGARDFFVASPAEGATLRPIVPDGRIFVLSGMWAGSERLFFENDLVPVISSEEQLAIFMAAIADRSDHPCALQIDTGMNRLGLTVADATALATDPARPASFSPVLVMSHLACADDPAHSMNRTQLDLFRLATAAFDGIDASLANSAGIFLGEDYHFDLTRPGISLYGGAAVNDVPNPMKPVVTAEARILLVRDANAGETVSYGASAVLMRDTRIAIAAIGYADGYLRSLSGTGVPLRQTGLSGASGFLHGQRVPVIGRITMDLSHFDVTDLPKGAVRAGDFIELFGPNIAIEDVARASGTIDYELLTSLGARYHRNYVEAER